MTVVPGVSEAQNARNFDIVRLTDGVYAFIQRETLRSPIDGNSTVIINDADVVVVDSKATPATARALIAEIRKLTSKPVRYVINTHWHPDHHYGNDAFRKAFPGVEIIGHVNTRADMLTQDTDSGRLSRIAALPRFLADGRKQLAAGKLPDGSPISDELRVVYEMELAGIGSQLQQLRETRITPPTMTTGDRLVLERGRRVIDIRFLGRANTRGDLVVYLPSERIVVAGDIIVAPVPFAFGSYLGEWVKTLAAIRSLDAAVVVPGHGAIQRDWHYVDQLTTLLQSTLAQVSAAIEQGRDLNATRNAVKLDSLKRVFAGNSELLNRTFENFFVVPAVERAFSEAKGQLEKP